MTPRAMGIAAAGVLLAAIAGWFRPTPLATHAINPHAAAWSLPAPADLERSSASEFEQARAAAWVGDGTVGAAGTSGEWMLLGVVGSGGERAILVRAGNDPLIKPFRAGDTLPDGSRLESVGSSGIVIERGGCRMRRPLYPAGTDNLPNPPACEPAATD